MDLLKTHLFELGFSESDWIMLKEVIIIKSCERNKALIKSGQIPNRLIFLLSGIVKMSYIFDNIEFVYDFREKNSFVCDIVAFFEQKRTFYTIETLTFCQWYEIDRSALFILLRNESFALIFIRVYNQFFFRFNRSIKYLRILNATERYLMFCEKQPSVLQVAKLGDIASFLNISQVSLSRIRKEIVSC